MSLKSLNSKTSTAAELFGRIRKIEIRTSRLVNELFGGRYHSTFKGRGMEFHDVREYIPGDDIRNIHWNVTARLGHPYVKRFTEERELTIVMAVDVSRSTLFGTRSRLKSELAAELVALLSFAALKNNDKIGLLMFSDRVENYVPPRKTKSHTLRMIRDTLDFVPQHAGTNIGAALEYLNTIQKKRAIVFVISDFIGENYEKALSVTHRRHDTISFVLEDLMEENWPKVGRVLLEDAESRTLHLTQPGRTSFLDKYRHTARLAKLSRNQIFKKHGIDHVIFKTDQDYVKPLLSFFKERARRFR